MNVRHHAHKVLAPILFGFALQGCGGDEEATTVADSDADFDVAIDGSVGDGPITGAQVSVHAKDGTLPPGVDNPAIYHYRSGGVILPRATDWISATKDLQKAFVEHKPEELYEPVIG